MQKILRTKQKLSILTYARLFLILLVFGLLSSWGSAQEATETATEGASSESYEDAVLRAQNFNGMVNSDWQPYIYDFGDGIEMVLVPVGCFMMGSTDEQIQYSVEDLDAFDRSLNEEQPAHSVCIDTAFWIDRTEVSQGDLERLSIGQDNESNLIGEALPVERIKWFEARAYCATLGKRLPTEAEWEYAARGVESLIFPWGNEFDGTRLNYCDENCEYEWNDTAVNDNYRYTAPIGSYPSGASWVGALDMSGNVWEWVSSLYLDYPYNEAAENEVDRTNLRVLRGGSYNFDASISRAASRNRGFPSGRIEDFGFRCARDID